jgi:hypothetical protein
METAHDRVLVRVVEGSKGVNQVIVRPVSQRVEAGLLVGDIVRLPASEQVPELLEGTLREGAPRLDLLDQLRVVGEDRRDVLAIGRLRRNGRPQDRISQVVLALAVLRRAVDDRAESILVERELLDVAEQPGCRCSSAAASMRSGTSGSARRALVKCSAASSRTYLSACDINGFTCSAFSNEVSPHATMKPTAASHAARSHSSE